MFYFIITKKILPWFISVVFLVSPLFSQLNQAHNTIITLHSKLISEYQTIQST